MDKSINVVKELFLGIILFSMNFLSAQSFSDWENPDINGINKENPHAYGFLSDEKWNIHGVVMIPGESKQWKNTPIQVISPIASDLVWNMLETVRIGGNKINHLNPFKSMR